MHPGWYLATLILVLAIVVMYWRRNINPPCGVYWSADSKSLYAITMTDPDAPSAKSPTNADWLHWMIVNIPGNNIKKGTTILPYTPPAPPRGSGVHRYTTRVWKQPGPANFPAPDRSNFATMFFADEQGWKLVQERTKTYSRDREK